MNFAPTLITRFERGDMTLKFVLAAFLIYWTLMLPVLFGHNLASTAPSRALTLPVLATMYWLASSRTRQLARALAVLGQLQSPHSLRRALVREKLVWIALAWAFLAGGLTLQLALPQAHMPALAGAALVSAAACLGMLRGLARSRLLSIPFAQLLDAAPYLAVIALIVLDYNSLFELVASLPLIVLALCALTFPYLALRLARRWERALPVYRWTERTPSHGIVAWLASQARRSTVLGQYEARTERDLPFPYASRVAMLSVPFLMLTGQPIWEGGELSLFRCLMLSFVVMMSTNALIVRDLHWRVFLMPAGLRRGRIGSHIVASTLAYQYCVMLLLAAAYAAIAHFGVGVAWDRIGQQLLRASTLPLELLLATSAAVVLRALPKLPGIAVALLCFAAGMAFVRQILHWTQLPATLSVPLPVFVLAMLGVSALLVGLANRVWTTNRLFAAARRMPGDF